MKKVLLSTFLFLIFFIFVGTYKADTNKLCTNMKSYKNLSTRNILDKLSYNEIKNIKKICSDKICTYNLNSDYNKFLSNHENKISNLYRNEERKIVIALKGIKIDTIYFKDCIY